VDAAPSFSARVVRWQRTHGRSNLPWQRTRDAYRVWLSEIMLQQTQVSTVVPYYERFLARFPDVHALAAAPVDEVLALWSGLGYYARARNLHRAACEVVERFAGEFPRTFDALATLPGIGRSTAAAIAAFSSGEPRAILDGNVKRVIARHAGVDGDPSSGAVLARLWQEAEARMARAEVEAYTQGMMDLGADVCSPRKPACLVCPVAEDCVARIESRIGELPGKRARKALPHRQVGMLVVLSHDEVLLEKRAASGIWGGLWSLPECAIDADASECLARDWGLEARAISPLPRFEHTFTHFTLEVAPWKVSLAGKHVTAFERPATWLPLSGLHGAALPSPVKRLLLSLEPSAVIGGHRRRA
jgi:A/G-specific adenine glycosylase